MLLVFLIASATSFSQGPIGTVPACTKIGYIPSKPILICGTDPYYQDFGPACYAGKVVVPFCGSMGLPPLRDGAYDVYTPTFFKFKCYASGTLGFVITPYFFFETFHWQLFDITGKDPDRYIFTNSSLVIAGFWTIKEGVIGAAAGGVPYFYCLPDPALPPPIDPPAFGAMPELIKDHEYLLMAGRTDPTQAAGFLLTFEGGTADITDPLKPHMVSAKAECSGKEITVKFNKKMACASLTATSSEFSIVPATSAIVSATATECLSSNGFEELKIILSAPLIDGNYKLVINNGTDGNTLLDLCRNPIPANESASFNFTIPQPIFADSVAKPACTPDSVKIYFPKKIICNTISAAGTDFSITGPQPLNIISARGTCKDGKTDFICIKFDKPITTKGNYLLTLKAGDDGSPIVDECGVATPEQTISFPVADTVAADFTYTTKFGCQKDTLIFSHDGTHDVNSWKWKFNTAMLVTIQSPVIIWPAAGTNKVQLFVSNGTCTDSANTTIVLDNEVTAIFNMPDMICPEDKLEVANNTTGIVHRWKWTYDILGTSLLKEPVPFQFPAINKEAYYSIKLVAYNDVLNCSDSTRKTLTVLDFCNIGVATAFTPNNDGLNDTFWPHNALKADNFVFKVYNRLGQLVFQSRTWRDKWDGKLNGVLQTTGVYVWMLSYTHRDTGKQVFQKGTVTLIR